MPVPAALPTPAAPVPAVGQSTGYSKLAAAPATNPAAPDWLWCEDRRLLPTAREEIQALCGRKFTLDAAASDTGDIAHSTTAAPLFSSCQRRTLWINTHFT